MTYAVELFFDEDSAAQLRRLWTSLQEVYGAPSRSELGAEPHLALAVFRAGPPEGSAELLQQVASSLPPLDLRFTGVEYFPTAEGVVYLRAEASPPLLEMHLRLLELLGPRARQCLPYYLPGTWIPHCTVATDVAPDHLDEVVNACRQSLWPGAVRAERVGGVSYRPARVEQVFPLIGMSVSQHPESRSSFEGPPS